MLVQSWPVLLSITPLLLTDPCSYDYLSSCISLKVLPFFLLLSSSISSMSRLCTRMCVLDDLRRILSFQLDRSWQLEQVEKRACYALLTHGNICQSQFNLCLRLSWTNKEISITHPSHTEVHKELSSCGSAVSIHLNQGRLQTCRCVWLNGLFAI